jgi:hypothetical protein
MTNNNVGYDDNMARKLGMSSGYLESFKPFDKAREAMTNKQKKIPCYFCKKLGHHKYKFFADWCLVCKKCFEGALGVVTRSIKRTFNQ